jgi:uncharacterized protein (DUF1330 family)
MKNQLKKLANSFILSAAILAGASSCNKEISTNNPSNSTSPATTATSSTIAVAVTASTSAGTANSATTDSVYVIHNCEKGNHRDSIAASDLSVAIQTYLTTNYAGNIFIKAFAVKDTTGNIKGYVVIVKFNDKPVAIQFTADGTFVKVLEQREKADLDGDRGWHMGGRFDTRDGLHRDTIPLTQLPSAITTYFANNYPSDTLTRAFETKDGKILVLSKNNGGNATIFTTAGVFLKRVVLPTQDGFLTNVSQTALPASILSYLTATYPNYVFDKADSVNYKGVLKGYLVIINANNTRYGLLFDASGSFVAVKAIG